MTYALSLIAKIVNRYHYFLILLKIHTYTTLHS